MELNRDAVDLVEATSASGTVEQVVERLLHGRMADSQNSARLTQAVTDFMDLLHAEGFLHWSEEPGESNFRIVPATGVKRFFVEMLSGCNLTCAHCYADRGNSGTRIAEVDRLLKHLDEAITLGAVKVDVTGGEALLHPSIDRVLSYLAPLNVKVNLYSNLATRDDDLLNRLKAYELGSVITSVDALDPELHDRIRGRQSSWDNTVGNIRSLVEEGIPVRANVVANELNIDQIQDLCSFLYEELGVTSIVVGTLFDTGRQQEAGIPTVDAHRISLATAAVYKDVFNRSYEVLRRTADHRPPPLERNTCGVGQDMVFLSSWGEYFLCPVMTDRETGHTRLGSLTSDTFAEVAERLENHKRHTQCAEISTCTHGTICRGGCRARPALKGEGMTACDSTRRDFFDQLALLERG
ncbi:MAG: radical SAM protein [bacterium]|nr:radical SAM protein [bacterium]